MTHAETVKAAWDADTAFDAALLKAGYLSRWDWKAPNGPPELKAAYAAKIQADADAHNSFRALRGEKPYEAGA